MAGKKRKKELLKADLQDILVRLEERLAHKMDIDRSMLRQIREQRDGSAFYSGHLAALNELSVWINETKKVYLEE